MLLGKMETWKHNEIEPEKRKRKKKKRKKNKSKTEKKQPEMGRPMAWDDTGETVLQLV